MYVFGYFMFVCGANKILIDIDIDRPTIYFMDLSEQQM